MSNDTEAPPTITAFLLARYDEDEALARAATPGPWWYDPNKVNSITREESVFTGGRGLRAITVCSTGPCDDIESMADARFIARHNPAHVLADIASKRAIVADHVGWHLCPNRDGLGYTDYGDGSGDAWEQICPTIRHLASVYADHADYQQERTP